MTAEPWTYATAGAHLERAGYKITASLTWLAPKAWHKPASDDRSAARFLIEHHGYGKIVGLLVREPGYAD